jgi:hypothetical protein
MPKRCQSPTPHNVCNSIHSLFKSILEILSLRLTPHIHTSIRSSSAPFSPDAICPLVHWLKFHYCILEHPPCRVCRPSPFTFRKISLSVRTAANSINFAHTYLTLTVCLLRPASNTNRITELVKFNDTFQCPVITKQYFAHLSRLWQGTIHIPPAVIVSHKCCSLPEMILHLLPCITTDALDGVWAHSFHADSARIYPRL